MLRPVTESELAQISLGITTLDLSLNEYTRLLNSSSLRDYARLSYAHSKPLEYLTTITLLDLTDSDHILDAAGGEKAEYTKALMEFTNLKLTAYCQDSLLDGQNLDGISYIGGSIDAIPLPDQSLDAISCHHSFEHFRNDLDVKFIWEAVRLLRVGGKLVITPLFLTNEYAEIWNNKHVETYDPQKATTLIDSTATFAGWGPYEGFARTYSPAAFKERILDNLPSNCDATIVKVLLDGKPVPDIGKNSHQPLLNAEMKALLIKKTKD
jgi:SAM-dependent methyltransferase